MEALEAALSVTLAILAALAMLRRERAGDLAEHHQLARIDHDAPR